jgi:RecJ-like exonuclease
MDWFPRKRVERRKGLKKPRTMQCPVCKGLRYVRTPLGDAKPWSEVDRAGEAFAATVERPCWACNGAGALPVEERGVKIKRFDR